MFPEGSTDFPCMFRLPNPVPDFFPGAFHREFPGGVSFERGAWVTSIFPAMLLVGSHCFPEGTKSSTKSWMCLSCW